MASIKNSYGVATLKFDGGESNLQPENPVSHGDRSLSPSLITRNYVKIAAGFDNMAEVSTGWGTQNLRVWIRMREFDSRWSFDNGLKSLVPTLLQLNINGYNFVIPGAMDYIFSKLLLNNVYDNHFRYCWWTSKIR